MTIIENDDLWKGEWLWVPFTFGACRHSILYMQNDNNNWLYGIFEEKKPFMHEGQDILFQNWNEMLIALQNNMNYWRKI